MKVLITGATGLIGSELVALCRSENIAVNYLTTQQNKITSSDNYNGFYWNPSKNEIDSACFTGVQAIVNLAGATISKRWTRKNKEQIVRSRLDSVQTLATALDKLGTSGITSFISASAIGIYPNSASRYYEEGEAAVDESFLGNVVRLWEEEADTFKRFDLKVSKVRTGLVLSRAGGMLPQMAKPVKNYLGAAFGTGEQWQSWIHISDLGRLYLYLIQEGLEGVFNGVAPNPVTQNKMLRQLADILDKPLLLPNIPRPIMKLMLGEMSYLLFASQRVSSKKIEAHGFEFDFRNICTALENLYQSGPVPDSKAKPYSEEFVQ